MLNYFLLSHFRNKNYKLIFVIYYDYKSKIINKKQKFMTNKLDSKYILIK